MEAAQLNKENMTILSPMSESTLRIRKKKMDILKEQPLKQEGAGYGLKTYYLKSGNTYRVSSEGALDLHYTLPVGTYIVRADLSGFYLETTESFKVPSVLYGDVLSTAQRILNTFAEREVSTGVLLCGEMGSGKTLLAKVTSAEAAKQDIPTIIVNSPYCGDTFNTFISTIQQPVVLFFDEFEKVYDEEHQQALLTLFDGVFGNKKLFVCTSNSKWKIDLHMKNRPGRFFYFLEFEGLDYNFIREYCEKNLLDKKFTEQVCVLATLYDSLNFDMLQAIVEEINRYGESPRQVIKFLNTKPSVTAQATYNLLLTLNGVDLPSQNLSNRQWAGNALDSDIDVYYKLVNVPEGANLEEEDYAAPSVAPSVASALEAISLIPWSVMRFTTQDIIFVDVRTGIVRFQKDNTVLTLTREVKKAFDYERVLA